MPDPWTSLRSHARSTPVGAHFDNPLLHSHAGLAEGLDANAKIPQGGSLLFSDSPETLRAGTLLVNGNSLASAGFRCVLCTDTAGLSANHRYRLFIHHVNQTGAPRRLRVVAICRGQAGQVRFGPVWKGTDSNVGQAGIRAVTGFLEDFPSGDLTFANPDAVPSGASTTFNVPAFTGSPGEVALLADFPLPEGDTLSAIAEVVTLTGGIQLYVALGDPPVGAYAVDNNDFTADFDGHSRGTFPERLIVRAPQSAFTLTNGEKTPGVFFLVNRNEGTAPFDTDWSGEDRTIWGTATTRTNGGNYGRVHLVQTSLHNPTAQSLHVAIVASPREPSSSFFGRVADLGAGAVIPVPAVGSVPVGDKDRGIVIWKGTIPPQESRVKRLAYTTVGGSAGKLNLWVVPYGGQLGPI